MTADARRDQIRAAFANDYQRMWDLVRYARGYLSDNDLITQEEYAELVAAETRDKPGQGSPSARRLESYDELRQKLSRVEAERDALLTRDDKRLRTDLTMAHGQLERQVEIITALEIRLARVEAALREVQAHLSDCFHCQQRGVCEKVEDMVRAALTAPSPGDPNAR